MVRIVQFLKLKVFLKRYIVSGVLLGILAWVLNAVGFASDLCALGVRLPMVCDEKPALIIFNTYIGGMRKLWSIPVTGGTPRLITTDDQKNEYGAMWSPDGEWIAFHSSNRHLGDWKIAISDPYGRKYRLINSGEVGDAWPSWSQTEDELIFQSVPYPGPHRIYKVHIDGSGRMMLADDVRSYQRPTLAPTDDLIVMSVDEEGGLYLMRKDGTNITFLVDRVVNGESARGNWSPDGKKIVYSKFDKGNEQICILTVDFEPRNRIQNCVLDDQYRDIYPSWSPDGSKIVFVSNRSKDGYDQVFLMSLDGSELQQLTFTPLDKQNPQWQPPLKN